MFVSVLLQLLFIATVALCISRRYFHPLSRYPGPVLASITNLWKFITYFKGSHHLVEKELHDRYGPVIRTGPDSLSFASLETFEAIYGYNKAIEKGDEYNYARDANNKVGSLFSARSDAVHKDCRRKVLPALTSARVATYRPTIARHTDIFHDRIATELAETESTILNIVELAKRFTLDTIVSILYGDSLNSGDTPWSDRPDSTTVVPTFHMMLKTSGGIPMLPWLNNIIMIPSVKTFLRKPTYDKEGHMIGVGVLASESRGILIDDPERAVKSTVPSIAKVWATMPEDDSRKMSRDDMWRESWNLVFAGQSSTSAALIAIMYELAQPHGQHWQRAIREDLSKSAKDADPVTSPVIAAVLKETMRLHAPFSTAFPRVIMPGAEDAIPGLPAPLPVGTVVSSNTYILGHMRELWGEDVEEWKPERFLVVDGDEEMKRRLDRHFVTFSTGPRGCIGKDIAMAVTAMAVAKLLARWNLVARLPLEGGSFLEMQYTKCEIEFQEVV